MTLSCEQAQTDLADFVLLELSAAAVDDLQRHLHDCPACRAKAAELYTQDRMLNELAARSDNRLKTRIQAALLAAAPRQAKTPPQRVRRRWIAVALAACLLLTPVLLQFFSPNTHQPETPQATFEKVEGEVYVGAADSKVRATPGLALLPGQVTRVGEEGSAIIAFPDATRLMLGAVTTMTWSQAPLQRKLFLSEGELSADMHTASADAPMTVTTPQAEVVAGRGQFNVCQIGQATHVESEKGTLQVRRLKDGRAVAVPSGNYAVVLADGPAPNPQPMGVQGQQARASVQHSGSVTTLMFSADGATLAAGGAGNISICDSRAGAVRRKLDAPGKIVRLVTLSSKGETVASAFDRGLSAWNLTEDSAKPMLGQQVSTLFALRFEDDGKTLIGCSYDRAVRRWDLATGKMSVVAKLKDYESDYDFPACMEFAPSGKTLAWGLKDNTARLWDRATATEKHILRGHEGAVTALAYDAVEAMLATGSRDRTICLWDLPAGRLRSTLHGHRHTINAAAFSPDCKLLATGSSDTTVKIWDVAFAREVATLRGHTTGVFAVAFSPDGKTLASGSQDGTVKLWNVGE